jgi:HK97 family phage prohead protease
MSKIITRAFHSVIMEVREAERLIIGTAVPYGEWADIGLYAESFQRGAFQGIAPSSVALTATHPKDGGQLPIGVATRLEENDHGLQGEWRVSRTALGDEVLALAIDQVPLGLSIGFIPDQDRWSQDRKRVVRTKVGLDHIAVVRVGAYAGAKVSSVREQRDLGYTTLLARLRR